ncbi:MAG: TasA family protein [Candidatus Shapirobacteria bacterium]
MKKKILVGFLIITFVTLVSIGVTKAYFTSSTSNDDNSFSSGTISLSISDENNQEYTSSAWNVENIAPGWNTGSNPLVKTFRINNSGSLDLKYQAAFNTNIPDGENNEALYQSMMIAYKIGNNNWVNDKKMEDLVNDSSITGTILANNPGQDILIRPYLPTSADNTAQGGTFNFNLAVRATQTDNPGFNE